MAMIHDAFRTFQPPSGVLKETVEDFAKRQRDGFVLVAMEGDAFIGSLFCATKDGALYLTRMATHPDWQKRGVGRALMAQAEREARAMKLPKLLIRVRQNLPENRDYFAKLGFAVTGEGQEDNRPPFDVMEKPL